MGACGGQDAVCLLRREADGFAKGVHSAGQARLGGCRDNLGADKINIGIWSAFIFWRQGVGGEQCGFNVYRANLAQRAGGT